MLPIINRPPKGSFFFLQFRSHEHKSIEPKRRRHAPKEKYCKPRQNRGLSEPATSKATRRDLRALAGKTMAIEDEKLLRDLLNKHYKKTGSNLALNLLGKHLRNEFIKIVPHDYERAMKKNGKATIEKNPFIIKTEQADNHELI